MPRVSDQIAVRLPDELSRQLADLVEQGRFASKADAIRTAVWRLLEAENRRLTGEQIAAGYLRIPQTDEEIAVATDAAIRSIHEEPW